MEIRPKLLVVIVFLLPLTTILRFREASENRMLRGLCMVLKCPYDRNVPMSLIQESKGFSEN